MPDIGSARDAGPQRTQGVDPARESQEVPMAMRWKFTAPKVALLLVAGLCAGYWVGRSVGSSEWRALEVVTSAGVAAVVIAGCRKRAHSGDVAVHLNLSRF
jgi:hypothetical protein